MTKEIKALEINAEIVEMANQAIAEIASIKESATQEIENSAIALFLYIGESMTNGLSAQSVKDSLSTVTGDYGFSASKIQFAPVGFALMAKEENRDWSLSDLLSKSERVYRQMTAKIKEMPKVEGESKPNTTDMAVKAIKSADSVDSLLTLLPPVVARNRAPKVDKSLEIGEAILNLVTAIESHTDLTLDAKYFDTVAKAMKVLAVVARANGIGTKKAA